ncbi:MAG: serine protease [Crocinitomicaceae bacterium]|nr:serine protease [Crocinitomicaceae bacterium]|tara:strand:+ start:4766 stop:5335 length:570 start_codon:yes stop_codon:yes gene_type:complete
MEYLQSLDTLLRTFWYIALGSSLIFAIQTVLTFMGADATDGLDADFDGDMDGGDSAFQLFSFRNLINFLLGFSWGGISFWDVIDNNTILIIIATLLGVLMVFLFFVIIGQIQKLQENNSFKLEDAINKTGEVYLKIPSHRQGMGKISVSIRGSYHELNAITEGDSIATGSLVTIIAIKDDNLLIVKPLK